VNALLRWMKAAAVLPIATIALTACSGGQDVPADALVIYNAQHKSVGEMWGKAFTKATGIKVVLRNGKDFELANQLVEEGAGSRADVFLTENSPAISVVERAGLFTPVDAATLEQVPERYSTTSGNWIGIAARSTAFVYNKDKIQPDALPKSILDLAKPEWKGRWGAAPGGADFQAIVSAVLELEGAAATKQWLAGMKANFTEYSNNIATMKAVNEGESDGGIIYHYYWYRDQAENKQDSGNTALHFFGTQTAQDPGAFVSLSGGGVLKGSKNADKAQQFLKYITGAEGQKALADSAEFEYSVGSDVSSNPALKPLDELESPIVDPSKLNGQTVITLMTDAGLI